MGGSHSPRRSRPFGMAFRDGSAERTARNEQRSRDGRESHVRASPAQAASAQQDQLTEMRFRLTCSDQRIANMSGDIMELKKFQVSSTEEHKLNKDRLEKAEVEI